MLRKCENTINRCICCSFLVTVVVVSLTSCAGGGSIPPEFIPCYRESGEGAGPKLPATVRTVVELIRKAEASRGTAMDMRTMSYGLLHDFRLDGIERAPGVSETEHVTPYSAAGIQYPKYKLLTERLVPGGPVKLPEEALTLWERCALHRLLSCGVQPWERGDEFRVCPLTRTSMEKSVGPTVERQRTRPGNTWYESSSTIVSGDTVSRCPIETGVVESLWGAVTLGTVVGAIAAALQPQEVRLADMLDLEIDGEFGEQRSLLESPPRRSIVRERMTEELQSSETRVNNIWAATLAGDLAEVSVFQGPYAGSLLSLGPGGRWNDSILPRALYFPQSHAGKWEMTDAEILGGIDGLIIAQNIPSWISVINRLRLSQVIEMYYSDRGIQLQGRVSACRRPQALQDAINEAELSRQTFAMSQVLAYVTSTVYVEKKVMEGICDAATKTFQNYTDKLLANLPGCSMEGSGIGASHPSVEMTVILDGTFDQYDTLRFLSSLADGADLSRFGSSISVMHGRTGQWIVPRTYSVAELFATVHNYTGGWPQSIDLTTCLEKLTFYLDNQTLLERRDNTIGNNSRVIIVVAQSNQITSTDIKTAKLLLQNSLYVYPDLYFRYVMKDVDTFKQLAVDRLNTEIQVQVDNTDPGNMAKQIASTLNNIPKRLITAFCKVAGVGNSSTVRDNFEDYITPGQFVRYRIHPFYLRYTDTVRIHVQGSGYGELLVCISRDEIYTENDCMNIVGQNNLSLNLTRPCDNVVYCSPVYLVVSVVKTNIKCAELDCRYPDQVRYTISHQGLQCDVDPAYSKCSKHKMADLVLLLLMITLLFKT